MIGKPWRTGCQCEACVRDVRRHVTTHLSSWNSSCYSGITQIWIQLRQSLTITHDTEHVTTLEPGAYGTGRINSLRRAADQARGDIDGSYGGTADRRRPIQPVDPRYAR